MTRTGEWMQTYTGRRFWPMDPRPEEVFIEDIAHALSMQCRFAGHCRRFYSVAEHSVHIARHVSPHNGLWGLLHDASEAFLVDVVRPLKPYLVGYRPAETRVMAAVCDRFGLARDMPAEVRAADNGILGDERRNMSVCEAEWDHSPKPLGIELAYWSPAEAENEFMAMFRAASCNAGIHHG